MQPVRRLATSLGLKLGKPGISGSVYSTLLRDLGVVEHLRFNGNGAPLADTAQGVLLLLSLASGYEPRDAVAAAALLYDLPFSSAARQFPVDGGVANVPFECDGLRDFNFGGVLCDIINVYRLGGDPEAFSNDPRVRYRGLTFGSSFSVPFGSLERIGETDGHIFNDVFLFRSPINGDGEASLVEHSTFISAEILPYIAHELGAVTVPGGGGGIGLPGETENETDKDLTLAAFPFGFPSSQENRNQEIEDKEEDGAI